jgi:hypothetical protein
LDDEALRYFAGIALLSLDQPQVGVRGRWHRLASSPLAMLSWRGGKPRAVIGDSPDASAGETTDHEDN